MICLNDYFWDAEKGLFYYNLQHQLDIKRRNYFHSAI